MARRPQVAEAAEATILDKYLLVPVGGAGRAPSAQLANRRAQSHQTAPAMDRPAHQIIEHDIVSSVGEGDSTRQREAVEARPWRAKDGPGSQLVVYLKRSKRASSDKQQAQCPSKSGSSSGERSGRRRLIRTGCLHRPRSWAASPSNSTTAVGRTHRCSSASRVPQPHGEGDFPPGVVGRGRPQDAADLLAQREGQRGAAGDQPQAACLVPAAEEHGVRHGEGAGDRADHRVVRTARALADMQYLEGALFTLRRAGTG